MQTCANNNTAGIQTPFYANGVPFNSKHHKYRNMYVAELTRPDEVQLTTVKSQNMEKYGVTYILTTFQQWVQ